MSKETLYLKYRPSQLEDVVGQKFTTATLKQASIGNKFAHAYLFSGNKGCGKTSTARILANLLTCENPSEGKVCGKCRACQTIQSGVSMDVIELDGAANGNVENIQTLIDGANWAPSELKRKVYIIDECLGKDSRINTEKGLRTISSIVNKKEKIRVWSWNANKKQRELKSISGWFRNSGKPINRLQFESEGTLYASDGHLVFTPNGYKKVSELKEGDFVYRMGNRLTDEQEQLLYGSLLGDASISKNRNRTKEPRNVNARIRFVQGVKQKRYLEYKYSLMRQLSGVKPKQYFHKGFEDYPKIETWSFTTRCSPIFSKIYSEVTRGGKKAVSREWLDKINWQGIAFWFCDDGSMNSYSNKAKDGRMATFHTQGFSYEENVIINQWLLSKGLKGSILEEKKNGNILYRIGLDKDSTNKMIKKIISFVPNCMKYKLGKKDLYDLNTKNGRIDLAMAMVEPIRHSRNDILCGKKSIVLEKIVKKELWHSESVTYDIEVEDNHNYFVSGTLVHNCHQLTGRAISALLKIVEEPPEYLVFVFCTTEPKKIPSTILSRAQRFNFRKITSKDIVGRLSYIAKSEKISITEEALFEIAKMSRGCLRDAIVPLEQISTMAAGKEISAASIQKYFGLPDRSGIIQMVSSMVEGNIALVMDQVNDMVVASADVEAIAFEISEVFRSIMLLKAQNGQHKLLDLPDHEIAKITKIGESVKMGQLDNLARSFSSIRKELEFSINDRWILESTLIHGIALLRKT